MPELKLYEVWSHRGSGMAFAYDINGAAELVRAKIREHNPEIDVGKLKNHSRPATGLDPGSLPVPSGPALVRAAWAGQSYVGPLWRARLGPGSRS